MVDASLAYCLPNMDGKRVRAILGTFRGVATLSWAKIAPETGSK
jgi:hypothetical protein